MKIFISWSGERSHRFAAALYDWLPLVIETAVPFLSSAMEKGVSWGAEIGTQLGETTYGLICVTPENMDSPWLSFEAGALAKHMQDGNTRVVPIGIGLDNISEIKMPIGMFQGMLTTEAEFKKLVSDINNSLEKPLKTTTIDATFSMRWPELQQVIESVRNQSVAAPSQAGTRTEKDMLQELLNMTRELLRNSLPRLPQVAATNSDIESIADSNHALEIIDDDLDSNAARARRRLEIRQVLNTHLKEFGIPEARISRVPGGYRIYLNGGGSRFTAHQASQLLKLARNIDPTIEISFA